MGRRLARWQLKQEKLLWKEAISTLLSTTQQDWENPEAYRVRTQAARAYRAQLQAYDKAFNVAHYHLGEVEMMGYVTFEALQFVFGAGVLKGGGKAVEWEAKSGGAMKGVVQIGNKLDYIFGKATGSVHNVERSTCMLRQLESIGVFDNGKGRSLLRGHLEDIFSSTKGIMQSDGKVLRESFLMGPNGGLGVQSYWKEDRLISVILLGGK